LYLAERSISANLHRRASASADVRRLLPRLLAAALPVLYVTALFAAKPGVHGTVRDPLGAVVPFAQVDLLDSSGRIAAHTVTDADGTYLLPLPTSGRYRVEVHAPTFKPTASKLTFGSSASADVEINVTLATPTLTEEVTVTATGTPTPAAQSGASVTVLEANQFRYSPEVQEPLRLVPGLQITQTGQTGGTTGLYIRGGNTNANKVLVDGVPANDIGGAVNFANIASVGVQSIEVLRQPNSSLYGSDALAGVVSLTTTRGTTSLSLLTYSGDGGNFGTYHQQIAASGVLHQFDYYSAFDRLDTRNSVPNSAFHNGTYAGNFGWAPNSGNDLRFTIRHVATAAGSPNATALYGIPDAAGVKEQDSFYSGTWNNQTTERWHNQIRYGGLRLSYTYTDYGVTGLPTSASLKTANYLGAPVTITGANGYSVSGQALFHYAGTSYPNRYNAPSKRDFVYAQTDFRLNPHTVALGSFTYEDERGSTLSTPSGKPSSVSRGSYSYTMQVSGDLRNRLFYTLGSGLEDNGLFGFAATPRASLAYYLTRPSSASWMGGTKLHGSFSKGIKEPSIYYQTNSLFAKLGTLPNGAQLTAQNGIAPIGPETSRTYDAGVDQELWRSRVRIGATYFHNEFTNGVEYVARGGLIQLGIPSSSLTTLYGAAVNSMAYRAQGLELEGEWQISNHLFARAGYTFLDALVQRSFSSDNLHGGNYNTASNFATTPIGAYSPLDGARPFRRAPQSGYFSLTYTQPKWYAGMSGTLVGKRDDSTFLSDANFGNSLLLPNRDLLGAYQRIELEGNYRVSRSVTTYARVQNLLSEHYFEAFGYPALPLTFRAGVTLSLGGESWKLK